MKVHLHQYDLPEDFEPAAIIAVDTETLGLKPQRDPLCLVQISNGDGECHVVQLDRSSYAAPRLKAILEDPEIIKIFHFARFDVAALWQYLQVLPQPLYCTKVASKLARTFSRDHGYRSLCKSLLDVELSKELQTSDWGAEKLSQLQLNYAARDVLHLHALKEKLDEILIREGRDAIAEAAFQAISTFAWMDLFGYEDVFEH